MLWTLRKLWKGQLAIIISTFCLSLTVWKIKYLSNEYSQNGESIDSGTVESKWPSARLGEASRWSRRRWRGVPNNAASPGQTLQHSQQRQLPACTHSQHYHQVSPWGSVNDAESADLVCWWLGFDAFFFFPSYQAWGWLEEESKASSERFAHENFSKSTSNTFVCLLKCPLNQSLSLIYRMWRRPRETSLRITAWNGNCLWASLKWAGRNRHLYR